MKDENKSDLSNTLKDLGEESKDSLKDMGETMKEDYEQTKADMENVAGKFKKEKDTDEWAIEER